MKSLKQLLPFSWNPDRLFQLKHQGFKNENTFCTELFFIDNIYFY